jgi:hypothetical protein
METTRYVFPLPPGTLAEGTNVIAVEVHQASPSTSDMIFDLSLSAVRQTVTAP